MTRIVPTARPPSFVTLFLSLACWSCWFLLFARATDAVSSSSGTGSTRTPPFLRYLTKGDLEAARQLAQRRHKQAVQDALEHFPIDDVNKGDCNDAAAVANTPCTQHPLRVAAELPDYDHELNKALFVSQKPLLTREECAQIIQMADDHFAVHGKNGEWTALPSGEYKMRGFELKDIPAIQEFFTNVFRKRFLPLVQHFNPRFCERVADLVLDNCYLMKFTPATGKRMDIHSDDGCLSFTIQMNPKEEYEGGGTWFEGLAPEDQESDPKAGIIKMDVGHVHFRPGGIRHMGNTITSGERYVIGGFPLHRNKVEYTRLLMRDNDGDDEFNMALPAMVALNPNYDDGYAILAYDWDTRCGRTKDAQEVLEYCLEHVNPKCSKVAFSLGVRHYLKQGQYAKVMELMNIVLMYDPYDVKAMAAMAAAAHEVGQQDMEQKMYERIVQVETVTPDVQADAYRDLGLLHKGQGEIEIDFYNKAIAAKDNYHARYSLGRASFEAGELEQARESFLVAYALSSSDKNAESAQSALKALYRTAKAILDGEQNASVVTPQDAQTRRLTELLGGEENYNKIQSMLANRFGYSAK